VPPAPGPTDGPSSTIRELRWSDFDPLREMYYLLYEERDSNPDIGITLFEERPGYADEARWFSGLYERTLRGDTVARIAEVGGQVVGNCVIGRKGPGRGSEMGHVGELGLLVHRDFRGRGVGESLLRASIAASRGTFTILSLRVFAVNERARALYARNGFAMVGRHPGAIRRRGRYLDDYEMVLDLRDAAPKD
jgi:RimJ/RimL family protein N-acetyltransferase